MKVKQFHVSNVILNSEFAKNQRIIAWCCLFGLSGTPVPLVPCTMEPSQCTMGREFITECVEKQRAKGIDLMLSHFPGERQCLFVSQHKTKREKSIGLLSLFTVALPLS